jgi:hypothetical protein
MRAYLSATLAAACALAAAAPAGASSIAYTKDSNVFLTSPDGQNQRPITTDGTAGNRYQGPAQVDDGTIVVSRPSVRFIYAYRQDGTQRNGPLLAPGNSCGSGPLDLDVTPNSPGLIVFQYIHSDYCFNPTPGNGPRSRVTFAFSDIPTGAATFTKHDNWTAPRWTPGSEYASMVSSDGGSVGIQGGGTVSPWLSSNPAVERIESFDISRSGNRVLVETTPPNTTNGPSRLVLWQNDGVPKSQNNTGHVVCVAEMFAQGDGDPRWSPDGSQIAWEGAAGIYVSPAPVNNGGTCVLQPRLVAVGGEDPAWGAANVPTSGSNGGNGGNGNGDNGDNNGNDNNGDNGDDQRDTTAPKLTVGRVGKVKLGAALSKGLSVPIELSEAARANATLMIDPATARRAGLSRKTMNTPLTVATGGRAAPSGSSKVAVKFTAKARKRLRKLKSVRLTLQVVAADAAGNQARSKTAKITLKR